MAENIILTGRSELLLNGGDVTVSDAGTQSCAIRGVCQSFKVIMGSTLALTGTDGTPNMPDSMGASVAIDVLAQDDILIQGSTLNLIGGGGFSPSTPYTAMALFGDISSGGSASLELKGGTDTTVIRVTDSTILVQGGAGGEAPDGQPPTTLEGGRGGGFSEGGYVLGKVGAGGDASVELVTTSLVLSESKIWVRAGKGGDAGDGGDGHDNDGGAGGGGYSGGRGADLGEDAGMPGGGVYGQVGSGGDATFTAQSIFYRQELSAIDLQAGDGGNAGEGGNTTYHGGGGGGGYSGGGGGSVPQGVGGNGGRVSEEVGSGGDAGFDIVVKNKLDMVVANVTARAGRGGRAGNGGSLTANGGAGGGGFSGGGGGGSVVPSEGRAGNVGGDGGFVTHDVASGGDTTVRIDAKVAYLESCGLEAWGGNGGDGGVAGIGHYSGVLTKWYSGGGGGSYSGGGGGGLAGAQYDVAAGGSGEDVTGRVGDGGNTTLDLDLQIPTIHRDCTFVSQEGLGGLCWASSADGPAGGKGSGHITSRGSEYRHVPMSKTVLWGPLNGYVGSDVPVFEWMPVHGSTTHGDVTGYVFEMDDVGSFASPDFVTTSRNPVLRIYELQKGLLYWHVRPLYSRPPERFGPWSEVFKFTHLNSPPVIDPVPQMNLTVKVPRTVDLTPYIHDPDDLPYLLTLSLDHPAMLWMSGFRVSLLYNEYQPDHTIEFSVSDGMAKTLGGIPVRVIEHNNDPIILGIGPDRPPVSISLKEGEELWQKVDAYDPDDDTLLYSLKTTWSGVEVLANGSLHIVAPKGVVDLFIPTLIVRDGRGGEARLEFQIRVENIGDPPERPVFTRPVNHTILHEGEALTVEVEVSDPDLLWGELLKVTVISNISGMLATMDTNGSLRFTTDVLVPGEHMLTAIVDDGTFQRRSSIEVTVTSDPIAPPVWEPPEGFTNLLLLVVLALAVLSVGYLMGYRRARRRRRLGS